MLNAAFPIRTNAATVAAIEFVFRQGLDVKMETPKTVKANARSLNDGAIGFRLCSNVPAMSKTPVR